MHKRAIEARRMFSLLLCCMLLFSCMPAAEADTLRSAPLSAGNTQNGMVRVFLSSLGNPATLNLTISGSYTINGSSSRTLSSGSTAKVSFNSATGNLTLTAGGSTTDMGSAFKLRRHEASGQNGIKIAQGRVPGNLYPGDFYFVVKSSGSGYKLYTIAYIYMEDYLYGVLPYEMGNSSGLEALKAQAVAARTYTMRAMSASSSGLYDVVDTTSDQVYSGTPSGNANCVSAVNATKGIVVKNGSAFTATYYTASNGGQIESIKNAWGTTSYTYLKVKDDPYDLANPNSRKVSFTVNASGAQSNRTLSNLLSGKAASVFGAGASITGVSAVTPHTPKYASPSRLYTKLDFQVSYTLGGQNRTGTLTFDIFNELESPLGMSINSGKNELWSVTQTAAGFTVTARRYGHGIGMSQRGAMYMGQMGYTYDQILAFYFEGCARVQYTLTRSILSAVVPGQDSQEQVIPENPAELEPAESGTAVVALQNASSSLPLRDGAGSTLAALPSGATVKVYATAGEDCLVGYGSLCGYVTRSFLSITGDIPSTTTQTPTQAAAFGTVVNSNALNLRSAPSMSGSTVYTTIPGGTLLPLLSLSGDWAYTQYGLRAGYVSTDYLQITGAPVNPDPIAPSATQTPQISAGLQARVNTQKGSLNLRATPSDSARVLTTIPQYTVISILSQGASWCQTSYNGNTGYVMTKFLAFLSTPAPTQTPAPLPVVTPTPVASAAQYARVTTQKGSLNLRATATDNGRVLRTIPQYETIEILERGASWCKTTYGGYTGFVMTKFLSFIAQSTATPPATAPTIPVTAASPTPTQGSGQETLYARVTTIQGSLNLRAGAFGTAQVLRTIPQYEYIPILERGAVWCKTTYGGFTGYVMTSFLTFVNGSASLPAGTASPTPTPASTLPSAAGTLYARVIIDQGALILRSQPADTAPALHAIDRNEIVIVLETGATFCKVAYSGFTGYVETAYLAFGQNPPVVVTPTPTARPSVPTAPQTGSGSATSARVTTAKGSLNLRAWAGENAQVLCTIPQYTVISILSQGAVWCQATYNGYTGYVMTKFLTFVSAGGNAGATGNTSSGGSSPTNTPAVSTDSQNALRDPTLKTLQTFVIGQVLPENGSSVNLRRGCSTQSEEMDRMPKFDYVVITAVGDTWCAIQYEGKDGFCLREYLNFQLYE